MGLQVESTGSACGAVVTGIDLTEKLSSDSVAELRAHWLEHKVLVFPKQHLTNEQLEQFTLYFGEFGEDPFFGHIEGHENIAAIQRKADEKAPVFAEFFHSDWSFLDIPPAGTVLYGITIPPKGGNTLFADQVKAYELLPDDLRDKADKLIAIHSAERGYAPDGVYGEADKKTDRSMNIIPSERAREKKEHPFVRIHPETGEKALFSSIAYIQGFVGMSDEEYGPTIMEYYAQQTKEELVYSHPWEEDMVVIWDNRSVLHSATGGYDGYDRLLHRTTVADTRF
ncbi:MAG: TauD/TfdA family dioxygenase [Aquisalinus sp.]|nr:TauD/TfdA family dioxygenase [Aquisalinus sp.]